MSLLKSSTWNKQGAVKHSSSKLIGSEKPRKSSESLFANFLLCPKCKGVPKIKFISTIKEKKRGEIEITCSCKYNKKWLLKDYLNSLEDLQDKTSFCEKGKEHNNVVAIEYCYDCQLWLCEECLKIHYKKHKTIPNSDIGEIAKNCHLHDNKKFVYFCRFCNKHLCRDCDLEYHTKKQHLIVNLKNDILKKSEITKDINYAKSYLNEDCINLKTSYINKLLELIRIIEDSYNDFLDRNNEILNFILLIMNNYTEDSPNYYQQNNLCENYQIKYDRFDENLLENKSLDNIDNLLDYFNNTLLLIDSIDVNMENFKEIKKLNYNNKYITSINVLKDGRIISSSMDNSIKVYNPINYLVELNILENDGKILYMNQLQNEKICCALDNRSLKIYDFSKNQYICEKTLESAHLNTITKIIGLSYNHFATCSADTLICIWETKEEYKTIKKLKYHQKGVSNILKINDTNRLISESEEENCLVVWDWTNENILKIMTEIDCINSTNNLIEHPFTNDLLIGGERGITIFSLNGYIIKNIIKTNELGGIYSFNLLRDMTILCGSQNGYISQYDIKQDKFFSVNKKIHDEYVSIIVRLDDKKIITASGENDISIKIFKY